MNIITKETLLKAMGDAIDNNGMTIEDSKLKIQQGNYQYVFNADAVNYTGTGEEFIVRSMTDSWTAQGSPTVVNDTVTLDGASWLASGELSLGGSDWQISGRVFEGAADMIIRRKIFELYSSADLNISLYSSGAGKNLDLLINCGGTFDNYNEPAILEREYLFVLKFKQSTGIITLDVDGTQVYQVEVASLKTRQTFNQLILGASVLHDGATFKGTISGFTVYDGYCEG